MNTASLPALWASCVDTLKDRVNNRSFWEALERTRPVALDANTLIIGLDSSNFNYATHIQQTARMHTVESVVSEVFGRPLQVRLIEGTTPADWEAAQERDQRIAAMKQTTYVRRETEGAQAENWDALGEYVSRLFAQMPHRSLPQSKARYANEALYALVEAMDTLYPDNPDEAAERGLARILERIAGASDIPAAVLAFELERLRAWRRAETDSANEAGDSPQA